MYKKINGQKQKNNQIKRTNRRKCIGKQQLKNNPIQAKSKKITKEKTGKANYEDDDSREEADRVLAGNRRRR